MSCFIGIDPGKGGAVGIISPGFSVEVFDAPMAWVRGTKLRREYSVQAMVKILKAQSSLSPVIIGIESVHAMPGQGVTSMFSMGYGLGLWVAIVATLGFRYELITPQRWQKAMLYGEGKGKDAARLKAQAMFPECDLSLKKHHGRADALLLAEYVRRIG